MDKLISIVLLLFMVSCNYDVVDRIDDDFYVTYVDIDSNRNVYYKDQGIFDQRIKLSKVDYNDSLIVVSGYQVISKQTDKVDSSHKIYYYILKRMYINNPEQMNSNAVVGPVSYSQYKILLSSQLNLTSISW